MKAKFFFSALAFLLFSFSGLAQKHEIGIAVGGLNYTGDLAPDYKIRFYRHALYGFYKHNFNPAFALRVSLLEGELYADDKFSPDPLPMYRTLQTGSVIVEFAAIGEYNFFDYRKERDRRRFTPYLAGGVGFFVFSQDALNRKEVSDGTGLMIPFGLGVKYKLSKRVNLGAEFLARKTFTDDIDGVSSKKINGLEVGDPHGKDWYYFTGFTLSYTFYGITCPQKFQ